MQDDRAVARAGSRRRTLTVLAAALLALALPGVATAAGDDPASLVNPFIGTQDYGNTFPGAALPFGMVQLSPDNGGQAGYDHDNTRIDGFSHTHLSGVGCGALGEVRVMPTTGAVASDRPGRFGSHYSTTTERAPGYYSVDLTKYGVRAELTATTRTGWHRYRFPSTGRANVLFDVGRANMPVYASAVDITGDRTLEGSVETGGFCGAHDRHRVFFAARFDRPFAAPARGGAATPPGGRHVPGARGSNGGWVTFDTTTDRTVGLEVGISYASLDGARRNLAAEAGGRRASTRVVGAPRSRAGRRCSRAAQVGGGSADPQRRLHDGALSRLPASERDRRRRWRLPGPRRRGPRRERPHGDGQLLALGHLPHAEPAARAARAGRRARRRALGPGRRACRRRAATLVAGGRGDERHDRRSRDAVPGRELVGGAAGRPRAGGLPRTARERARRAAAGSRFGGRSGSRRSPPGLHRERRCPARPGGGSDCAHPASATLEYAAADGALALMATGTRPPRRRPAARPPRQGLPHAVGPATAALQPAPQRRRAGSTPTTRAPARASSTRAAPTSTSGSSPRTPPGSWGCSAAARGGQGGSTPSSPTAAAARPGRHRAQALGRAPLRVLRAPTYNPNNEPDLHAPYLYAWTGQPWKTATVVRAAETLFTNGPEGHDRQRRPRHDVGLVRV